MDPTSSFLGQRGYQSNTPSSSSSSSSSSLSSTTLDSLHPPKSVSSASSNNFLLHNNSETPSSYSSSYSALKSWIHSSLDMFRSELLQVLYPLFAHCYLDLIRKSHTEAAQDFMDKHKSEHMARHSSDITALSIITTPNHLAENTTAQTLLNSKFCINMCSYSYELLILFLQDSNCMILLSLTNRYVDIKVFGFQPNASAEEDYTMVSATESNATVKPVKCDIPESLAVPAHVDTSARPTKRQKGKAPPPPVEEESTIPLPRSEEIIEARREEYSKRAILGSTSLPSIAFYTFVNTSQSLNCVEISKDGSLVAAGFADSTLKMWDLNKKKISKYVSEDEGGHWRMVSHSGPVYAASFSPDKRFLLSCSEDSTARLWSRELKSAVVAYKGHNYPIWDVKFSPLGHYFATASHDKTCRLWSTDHAFPLRIFAGHLSDVDCVTFHPNCTYVATGSSDKTARFWDINSGECTRVFAGHFSGILTLAVSPDGKMLATAGEDHDVILWDIGTGKKISKLSGHVSTVYSLDFSNEGSLLASGGADNTVRIWDVNKAQEEEDIIGLGSSSRDPKQKKKTLLATYPTKRTPVFFTRFTHKNLLLGSGGFTS